MKNRFKERFKNKIKFNPKRCAAAFLIVSAVVFIAALITAIVLFTQKPDYVPGALDTSYDLIISFSDDMNTVGLREDMLYTNNTKQSLNEIVFRLYPNAFSSLGNGKNGKIEVLSAQINNIDADFVINAEDSTLLSVSAHLDGGETATVSLDCKITLPVSENRFGKNGTTINLVNFYPVLSVFENGKWRDDPYTLVGDPFYSSAASYYVTADIPTKYVAATSGYVAQSAADGDRTRYEIVAEDIRDYALVVSDKFQTASAECEIDGKTVTSRYYYYNDEKPLETAGLAADALKTFSAAFGNYPFADYSVVQSPLSAGGMEYGGLCLVAPAPNRFARDEVVVHETAHQWWYGAVGSDQITSAWLDEGLTEFCTAYYFKLNGKIDYFTAFIGGLYDGCNDKVSSFPDGEPPIERPLSAFENDDDYVLSTYIKGALLFETLRSLVGDGNFNAVMQTYYKDNYMKIANKENLYSAFKQHGYPISSLIDNYLSGKAKL